MLKKSLFTGLLSLIITLTFQSVFAQDSSAPEASIISNEGSIDDLLVRPMRLPALQEIGGNPFMTSDYKTGKVIMDNDLIVTGVPIKFNIFSNAIMIQKDGQEMKLESFKLVSYEDVQDPSNIKHVEFGQGYPEVDNHNSKSVYQVLSNGTKVKLLKYLTQKIEDVNSLGEYSKREIVTTEQLYIYIPGGTIKKIKSSKKDIKDLLPELSTKIDEFTASKNLKMKSEADIVLLVDEINKP